MGRIRDSAELRAAVFAHLDRLQRSHGPYLTRTLINSFAFEGQPLSLMVQNGIRTPSGWTDALTITSTGTAPEAGGYLDEDRERLAWKYDRFRQRPA